MPRKKVNANSRRRERRVKLAGAFFAGKSIAEVAREEGITRSWASREAHAPETGALIIDIVNYHANKLHDLFERALQVIADALVADKIVMIQGQCVNLGPDHWVRLTAVKTMV